MITVLKDNMSKKQVSMNVAGKICKFITNYKNSLINCSYFRGLVLCMMYMKIFKPDISEYIYQYLCWLYATSLSCHSQYCGLVNLYSILMGKFRIIP